MIARLRDNLGWIGLTLVAAGMLARLVPWARGWVGWVPVWVGVGVLALAVALDWRRLVERLVDWWVRSTTFLGQVRSELERVTWPSRTEVWATTFVVVVTSIFFGVYLYGIDLLLNALVQWIFRTLGAA